MKKRVLIAGDAEKFYRYGEAIRTAGGTPIFPAEYSGVFIENYDAPARNNGESVRDDHSLARNCDALLLPGGGDWDPRRYGQENTASRNLDPERDQREWELLDRFTAAGKPILGICRGMQSINIFFGGTLCQDIPGHGQINGEDRIHPVFSAPGIFAALWGNNERDCIVNSAHHQVIDRPGDGLRVEQWAADGVAEALRHTRLPVWGVQWHPERLPGPIGRRLFAAFLEQIP